MGVPRRLKRLAGRKALVDGIPFELPISSSGSPALMAAFPIDARAAARLLPGDELHPVRLGRKAILIVAVIDYRKTVIGKYIEFSIGIACTHGKKPAPPILPLIFRRLFGTGQYVVDLPVSSEISVKGGKGIWGMPKHQASLDFRIEDHAVSSQYNKDGQFMVRITIDRPGSAWLPMRASGVNYCQFRGMLMKSYIHFRGRTGVGLGKKGSARLELGSHPGVQSLKELEIGESPLFTAFIPESSGILDDHIESWFLSYGTVPEQQPEGLESVVDLGLSEEWLDPPRPDE